MISLPEILESLREPIEASLRRVVRLRTERVVELPPAASRLGGVAWLPSEMAYPHDRHGTPLRLLAQLNFAEMPALPGYPEHGWLQCYVGTDALYGLDLDSPHEPHNYRVIYFESDATCQPYPPAALAPEAHHPVRTPLRLRFDLTQEVVTAEDLRFANFFGRDAYEFFEQFGDEAEALREAYAQLANSGGHKVGGYATFTQEDPRLQHSEWADHWLLLQIDSEGRDVVWGDYGIGHFFIAPQDLRQRNFSRVRYSWDSP